MNKCPGPYNAGKCKNWLSHNEAGFYPKGGLCMYASSSLSCNFVGGYQPAAEKVVVVERPDTDAIVAAEDEYYAKSKNLQFKECLACNAKLGSPTLCSSCYHNRRVIYELRRKARLR